MVQLQESSKVWNHLLDDVADDDRQAANTVQKNHKPILKSDHELTVNVCPTQSVVYYSDELKTVDFVWILH